MFQDQNMQENFSSLSSEKQAEVANFIQFLHQKQKRLSSSQIDKEKISELLLGKGSEENSESFRLWDEVIDTEDSVICTEPVIEH